MIRPWGLDNTKMLDSKNITHLYSKSLRLFAEQIRCCNRLLLVLAVGVVGVVYNKMCGVSGWQFTVEPWPERWLRLVLATQILTLNINTEFAPAPDLANLGQNPDHASRKLQRDSESDLYVGGLGRDIAERPRGFRPGQIGVSVRSSSPAPLQRNYSEVRSISKTIWETLSHSHYSQFFQGTNIFEKKLFNFVFVILLHIYRLRLYASEIFRTPLDPQSLATEVAGLPRNVVMGRTRTARWSSIHPRPTSSWTSAGSLATATTGVLTWGTAVMTLRIIVEVLVISYLFHYLNFIHNSFKFMH